MDIWFCDVHWCFSLSNLFLHLTHFTACCSVRSHKLFAFLFPSPQMSFNLCFSSSLIQSILNFFFSILSLFTQPYYTNHSIHLLTILIFLLYLQNYYLVPDLALMYLLAIYAPLAFFFSHIVTCQVSTPYGRMHFTVRM